MTIQLRILDRDEKGSTFSAKFNAQGCFDCEVKGYFRHSYDLPAASSWDGDFDNFGTVNGLTQYPIDEILALLGNGCMDIGNNLLDEMISPHLDDDYSKWCEWIETEARHAEIESNLNNSFFMRQAGF